MKGAKNEPKSIRRKDFPDYSFAFNDRHFSDRTLQIMISMGSQEIGYDGATCLQEDDEDNDVIKVGTEHSRLTQQYWRKAAIFSTRSEELNNFFFIEILDFSTPCSSLSISRFVLLALKLFSNGMREIEQKHATLHISPSDNNEVLQNPTENAIETAQESSSDDTVTYDSNGAIKVRTVHVNSAILAESSQFFNKLFSIGMRETEQRRATIHISPSEKHGFMYLLKFMYGGTIETQSTKELLDVLRLADKYEVPSCIDECTNALHSMPMTMELASLFLCLPSSLLTADGIRRIIKSAKGFLLTNFSEREFAEDYMNLPLQVIEELLKSDDLLLTSEDYVYDFAIDWAERRYYDHDERREVFQNKLIKLIRFPQMTEFKLAKILSNEDMQTASVLKLVSEALYFKGGCYKSYHLKDKKFYERSYKLSPIRAIELKTPKNEYRVFWDFNKDEQQRSQYFYMWGQICSLSFYPPNQIYALPYYDSIEELIRPVECLVFMRSKLSHNFVQVSCGKLTSLNGKRSFFMVLNSNIENYTFNNVIHARLVFT